MSRSSFPDPPLVLELQHLVEGLLYPSETDVPFTVSTSREGPSSASLREGLSERNTLDDDLAIEVLAPVDWLAPLGRASSPEDHKIAERFVLLLGWTTSHLRGAVVFKVGSINVRYVLCGQIDGDLWVSLITEAVET